MIMRRSDYPKITKKRIMDIVTALVGDETTSFSKIANMIRETRVEIFKLAQEGSKDIAKPVSFSKDLNEYKGMTQHIGAMQLFNALEYDYFVQGTKGYLFYITGIDKFKAPEKVLEKLNDYKSKKLGAIAIPWEENSLPEYYTIDIEKTLKFAWEDRVTELLAPISRQIELADKTEDDDDDFFNI